MRRRGNRHERRAAARRRPRPTARSPEGGSCAVAKNRPPRERGGAAHPVGKPGEGFPMSARGTSQGTSVTIYTDGACKGNPGPGGWGALLVSGTRRKEIFGG